MRASESDTWLVKMEQRLKMGRIDVNSNNDNNEDSDK